MKHLLIVILFSLSSPCLAQYALYNTGTLFDSFENPAQKAFKADTSRKYAFNFFFPHLSTNFGSDGPADPAIKNLIINGTLKGSNLEIGPNHNTDVAVTLNNYLFAFKVFKSIRRHRELGFSWQVRSDSQLRLTNEFLALFNNYTKFEQQVFYTNPFNSKLNSTSFHQFSITYRKNLDKKTGVGIKASYLSGMVNLRFKIDTSGFERNNNTNKADLYLRGFLRSNVPYKEFNQQDFMPGIKNPGLAITFGANHRSRSGWFFLGNVKDLGFIKWNKESYKYTLDNTIKFASTDLSKQRGRKIDSAIRSSYKQSGYITAINTRAEAYVSRQFLGLYTPALLLSKNIFYDGADIALTNNLKYKKLNLNISTSYSTLSGTQIGAMGMVKSDNAEFYIGSENLLKTYYTAKGIATKDTEIGDGSAGASFYMGLAVKFGRIVEHNSNTTYIPGVGEPAERGGFLRRIFRRNR